MAFNLVNHFRKYQKMWMASVLLLCMITFVLCTGVSGDLSDLLLRWFATPRGELLASIGGRHYYWRDLDELRKQRNLANEFMLQAVLVCRTNLLERKKESEKVLGDPKASESRRSEAQRDSGLAEAIHDELLHRTEKKQRYFETGVKLDELADFILWRNEADRLGINLVDDKVLEMMYKELFNTQTHFESQVQAILWQTGRSSQFRPTMPLLLEALRQEYRVRLAQLALVTSQPSAYQSGKEREVFKLYLPLEGRVPLTPAQLWDIYQQKRTEFDVALVPVHVADYLKQVEAPNPQELAGLFEQHKKDLYDPTAATPGFKVPQRVKVEWIGGDPESPYYQRLARAVHQLQGLSLARDPLAAGLAGVVRFSTSPLAWEGYLDRVYEDVRGRARRTASDEETLARQACRSVAVTDPDVLPALVARLTDRPAAAMVASLVGGLGRPDGFLAGPVSFRALAYQQQRPLVEHLAGVEARLRAPLYAGLVADGAPLAAGGRLAQAAYARTLWSAPHLQLRILPLAIVRPEIEKVANNKQAQVWVQANMALVWRQLNDRDVRGKPNSMSRRVKELIEEFSLQHGLLTEFLDRHTIAQAPALAPLKKSFDTYFDKINLSEGRDTPARRLQEKDFYKLFFDGESFAATGGNYQARLWPPEVTSPPNPFKGPDQERQSTTALWDEAEKPFLFWKTKDEEARVPDTLEQVKERVEQAWKRQKARDKLAWPQVKVVAQALEKKPGAAYGPVLKELEKKLGREVIYDLKGMAQWSPSLFRQSDRMYGEYTLPKGLIDYPPDDLVQQLLTLPDPGKPWQTGSKDVDALNKQLFDDCKKLPTVEGVGKYVQVLTNKPRTIFFVACVVHQGIPDFPDFAKAVLNAAGMRGQSYDHFLDRCQDETSKEFREALLRQLRDEQKVKLTDDKKTRDSFDSVTNN